MLEEALSRLIEGILSGIGIGFIFFISIQSFDTLSLTNIDISFVLKMMESLDLEMRL